MGEISKQIFFNATLSRVWQIWTDVEKTPEWVYGVQESRPTGLVKEGKGAEWQEKCQFGSKVIQMDHEFTEFEPLKKTVIRTGLPMGGSMERTAEFKESPQGTEVNVLLEWDLGMIGAFFDEDKLRHMMGKSFDETARKWKEKAEQG